MFLEVAEQYPGAGVLVGAAPHQEADRVVVWGVVRRVESAEAARSHRAVLHNATVPGYRKYKFQRNFKKIIRKYVGN